MLLLYLTDRQRMQFSDRPIFILGAHKSGTSLLRNLLDGHSALFAAPIEMHFPHCMGLPAMYPRRRQLVPGEIGKQACIQRMETVVREYDTSGDERADSFLPGRFDLAALVDHLQRNLGEAVNGDALFSYTRALVSSLGMAKPLGERHLVEKSVDNIEHAYWLKGLFPKARFLFIVRDPHANLVSFRKFIERGGRFPSLVQPVRTLELAFHHAALYEQTLPDLHVLRYEDLLTDPQATMERVCLFLDIPWEDGLLQPTSMGEAWAGNSTTGQAMKGVSAARLSAWRKELLPVEAGLIARSSLGALMPRFGYAPLSMKGFWRMAKGEDLRTYLRNRLYRLFADGS